MSVVVYLSLSELKPFAPDPVKQARYEAYLSGKQNPSGKQLNLLVMLLDDTLHGLQFRIIIDSLLSKLSDNALSGLNTCYFRSHSVTRKCSGQYLTRDICFKHPKDVSNSFCQTQ